MQQILIIGNDLDSCKNLKYALRDKSMRAYYTLSLKDGIRHLIRYGYQLVILDMSFPDTAFKYSVQQLQQARCTPVLVLSPCGESDHVEQVLSVADDFLQKPYDIKICRAKINALLRRPVYRDDQDMPGVLSKDGTLMIDARCRKVYILDTEITLPRKQYELLYLLASNEGRVFTHEQLYRSIWGDDLFDSTNTLGCQIRKLRRSLESVAESPKYIQTIRGVGYRFDTNIQ